MDNRKVNFKLVRDQFDSNNQEQTALINSIMLVQETGNQINNLYLLNQRQRKDSEESQTCSGSLCSTSESLKKVESPLKQKNYNNLIKISEQCHQREQNPPTTLKVSNYSEKRCLAIKWIQNNGQAFKLTRQSQALALYYCDAYYKVSTFQPKKARSVLAVVITLASKQIDEKILYSKRIADLFDIPYNQYAKIQRQVCQALDYQLGVISHAGVISYMIKKMFQLTSYNMFEQRQETYVKLRYLYWLAEMVYKKEMQFTEIALYLCFKHIFQQQYRHYQLIEQFINALKNSANSVLAQNQSNESNLQNYIDSLQQEWKQKQKKIKQTYRDRKQILNYTYNQFRVRYFA